jgi:hypothetical protein
VSKTPIDGFVLKLKESEPVVVSQPSAYLEYLPIKKDPYSIKATAVMSMPEYEYAPNLDKTKPHTVIAKVRLSKKSKCTDRIAEAQVKSLLNEYTMGTWSYKVPEIMQKGTTERVVVQLSSSVLKALSSASVKIAVQEIKIYPYMSVKVLGEPKFQILELSTTQQLVSSDVTTWNFDVTPKETGMQQLTIRITARIKMADGSAETRDLPIVTKDIQVSVTTWYWVKDFINKNWQWFVGLITGSGVLSWLFQRKKDKEIPAS